MQQSPDDPRKSFELVQTAIASGNVRIAIARLESLLVQNPALSNLRLELGLLYLENGSPQLAQRFIEEAMRDPSIPPGARARADQALSQAVTAQRGWSIEGELSVSVRAETNATAAPGDTQVQFVLGGQEVSSTLDTEDTEQSDVSFVTIANTRATLGFGNQAGDRLVGNLLYFSSRYVSEKDLDLDFFSADVGPEFQLGTRAGIPGTIRPYATGALVRKDGRNFQSDYGGGVEARVSLGTGSSAGGRFDARVTDFRRTPADPNNNERDALLLSFRPDIGYQLLPDLLMRASLGVARNLAAASFESYWEAGSGVQLTYAFADPTGLLGSRWTGALGADYRFPHT